MNIDPREFERQERALREDAGYRVVVEALRGSPGEPPADFAASVAALAESRAHSRSAAPAFARGLESRIERWLLRALAIVLGLSVVVVVATQGKAWAGIMLEGFGAVAAALGGATALNWVLAAGACMVLSLAFAQLKGTARAR